MSKELVMELAKKIKEESIIIGGWNSFRPSCIEVESLDFYGLSLKLATEYADSNTMIIFKNESNIKKTNEQLNTEGAEFNDDYEEFLNEFKNIIYSDLCSALRDLGLKVIESVPDANEFKQNCLNEWIYEKDIDAFGDMERFDLVCKIIEPNKNNEFNYQMLGRLKSDCEYYLGCGNRSNKRLYYLDEQNHIDEMKKLYNSFPDDEKPQWLTYAKILSYEKLMVIN